MAKDFSTIKELTNFKKSFGQQRFLYPLFFQDSLYGIAYNRFVNESKYCLKDYRRNNNEFHFLKLKRLIKRSRQSDFSWIFSNQFIDKFHPIFREILIIVFHWIFSYRLESAIKKPKNWNWNSYQSLHSVFPFLEDNIYNSTICLEFSIPYSFHPETFIRIFRQHVQDILFIHLLRLLLYQNKNCIILKPFFYGKNNQFHNLLWNFYLYKFESSLDFLWKKIYNFKSTSFWFFLDRTNFGQKIENISKQSNLKKIEKKNIAIKKNISIHYMRYTNHSILITNNNLKMFGKNWTIFLILFWEKYFHFWFEPNRIFTKDLSKSFICFLGYIFHNKTKPTLTQIQLINRTINTNLITKEFCIITPIIYLIQILAKEKFCDNMGRPICKLSWTTLADYEIFKRFDEITKTIFFYYSGSLKKKGLYQLQYILRFSCAKTLACKHKSTIRNVWKRYGSNFITHSTFLKRIQSNFSNFWQINSHEHKIWYLSITQINYLVNLFQKLKLKNVQNL